MASPTTSIGASPAASTSASPAAPTPEQIPAAAPSGDSDSAALLRMLRTNAVTPSKEPSTASPASAAAAAFTTPTLASHSTNLLSASASKATPPSGRRGPGRPKKSESGSKHAAKWDDEVTSLLLKFRYDDMKNAFEGVRNNVEVGECWIQLAQELTRLSGKSFDSHQCQSKLRNLKKTWREMSSSSKASSSTSSLYRLLSQYLGEDGGKSSRRISMGGNNSNNATIPTDSASGTAPKSRGGADTTTPRSRNALMEEHEVQADEQVENGVEVDGANTGEDTEEDDVEAQDGSETTSAVTSSTSEEAVRATAIVTAVGTTEIVEAPVTRRIRSDSLSSASSESSAAVPAPLAKRQKRSEPVSKHTAPTTATVDIDAAAVSTVAAAIPTAVTTVVANLGGGRIDSSLLSVASGLRTMMEGVIASKEESSDQQQILAELREHNTLMKTYCEEVSKQTTSLNALIKLLTEKVSSIP